MARPRAQIGGGHRRRRSFRASRRWNQKWTLSCSSLRSGFDAKVSSRGGLLGDITDTRYHFEVSNGGEGEHVDHDEIYFKGKGENGPPNEFGRSLEYVGTYLLRVRVRPKDAPPSREAQVVLAVRGVR